MASITTKWEPKDQWVFPPVMVTTEQERKIAAVVAEIALKAIIKNFSYKFRGKYYHQQEGGPIQTWKKLQAALTDTLSDIPLF